MDDKIFISGIECYGYHGVTGAERRVGNRFQIDVVLEVDVEKAAASDGIKDAVDYRKVHRRVVDWIEKKSFKLLETMATSLADELLQRFDVHSVRLKIRKLAPRLQGLVAAVGIEIYRRRAP